MRIVDLYCALLSGQNPAKPLLTRHRRDHRCRSDPIERDPPCPARSCDDRCPGWRWCVRQPGGSAVAALPSPRRPRISPPGQVAPREGDANTHRHCHHEDGNAADTDADRDPFSNVRRSSRAAGGSGWRIFTRRASARAVISSSTLSRNDATTASLHSGPSSSCAVAAARISWGDNGESLLADSLTPVAARHRQGKPRERFTTLTRPRRLPGLAAVSAQ